MSRRESYGEAFEFNIRNILNEGDLSRRELFEWWLERGPVFFCRRCEEGFTPPEDVTGDDEILCPRCQREARP